MKNYQKVNVPAGEARVELHDSLNLTGAEVSISNLPAGAGDWLRVAPAGERQLSAAADSAISVICIQVKAGSLEGFTMTDGVVK